MTVLNQTPEQIIDRSNSTSAPALLLRYFSWESLPQEVLALRRQTFVDEKRFLDDENLTSSNDRSGVHIAAYSADGTTLLGATHVIFAEVSDWGAHTGVPAELLTHAVLSSRTCVSPGARFQSLFSLLYYAAMRWARLNGRTHYVGHIEEGMPPFRKMVDCEIYENLPKRRVIAAPDREYDVVPAGGDVDYAMYRAYATLSKSLKEFVRKELMPDELERTLGAAIAGFYENPWFDAVWDECLTRNQYIAALANLHQYVRWTTRLLATIAGATADAALRAHFLEHLTGEIDHERMLERDLEVLGADVDFVVHHMAPQADIFNFMSVQQSLAAFERDPVTFLAVPLVAEGLSANLSSDFVKMLERNVARWGVEKPKHAISFLASHIHTDGGERGHWQAVIKTLAARIESESMQQKILTVIHAIIGSMNRAYSAYVRTPDLRAFAPRGVATGSLVPRPPREKGAHLDA